MSVPYDTSLSMLKPGRMPWSSAFWNAETPSPSPYCASDLGHTFTVAPDSLTRCHTWSGHPWQWLKVLSERISFSFQNSSNSGPAAFDSVVILIPSRRASAQFSRFIPENIRNVTS